MSDFGVAMARFQGLLRNMPNYWDVEAVENYHSIVSTLEHASNSDLNLSEFKIPDDKMKPRLVSAGSNGPSYSKKLYCDGKFAKQQVEGLAVYLEGLKQHLELPKIGF